MSTADPTIDLDFCQEQVLRIRPGFRITRRYASPRSAARLLALYAWLSAIEETVSGTSDPDVARAKLAWWYQELLGQAAGSNHPIVRLLLQTGTLERLPVELLHEEVRLAMLRIDRESIADIDALMRFSERLGANQGQLEMALDQQSWPADPITAGCARLNGLVQLVRESVHSPRLGCWWLPLDLCARFGVSRDIRMEYTGSGAARQALETTLRKGLSWQPDWRSLARRDIGQPVVIDSERSILRHWLVHSRLQARQLRRLAPRTPARPADVFATVRPADALAAWRLALRLRAP